MKNHLYLFTLEVTPIEVGKVYGSLPSHLTLMSRFWSDLPPNELVEVVRPLFKRTPSIQLLFGKSVQLGPKKLTVHLIEYTKELKALHSELRSLLDTTNITFAYPQYVGDGHKPHVTKREGVQFAAGYKQFAAAIYLIEIVDQKRVIRSKFELEGTQ